MGAHMINDTKVAMPVYRVAALSSDEKIGTVYNGEVYCYVKNHTGYSGVAEVRFLSSSGKYTAGFMNGSPGGNLMYAGQKLLVTALGGNCYRFFLRKSLKVVNNSGSAHTTLAAGDAVYTTGATCGQSNTLNMKIIGYRKSNTITKYSGFVTLNYTGGSMFANNFCLKRV